MQGPNVKKLISQRIASLAIPANTPAGGGLAAGIAAITTPGRLVDLARQATKEIEDAIAAVKAAPDNPYGTDDEAIAAEILRQVEEKKRANPYVCDNCGGPKAHSRLDGIFCPHCDRRRR